MSDDKPPTPQSKSQAKRFAAMSDGKPPKLRPAEDLAEKALTFITGFSGDKQREEIRVALTGAIQADRRAVADRVRDACRAAMWASRMCYTVAPIDALDLDEVLRDELD